MRDCLNLHQKGFSLAELLLVLLILAQIAVFSIPKLLNAQNDSRSMAIAKETAATINALYINARIETGNYNMTAAVFQTYLNSKMNYLKKSSRAPGTGMWYDDAYYVLPSGAYITYFNSFAGEVEMDIDVNGPALPNAYCPGTAPSSTSATDNAGITVGYRNTKCTSGSLGDQVVIEIQRSNGRMLPGSVGGAVEYSLIDHW